MARQATREQRLAEADFVVPNDGTPEELAVHIDACWNWITQLEATKRAGEGTGTED